MHVRTARFARRSVHPRGASGETHLSGSPTAQCGRVLIATLAFGFGAAACGSSGSDAVRSAASSGSVSSAVAGSSEAPTQPADRRSVVTADDGHSLVVWERHTAGESRGEVVLLHGLHWSARPDFDLQVPGQNVSLMDNLAARGYTVYAVDQRGYGDSKRDATGWITPDRAARDAQNVVDWVTARAPNNRRPALLGWSMGSLTAMLVAQRSPAAISGLVLFSVPPYAPEVRAPQVSSDPPRKPNTAESAGSAFITPAETPPGVKDAYVELALETDPVEADWRGLSQLDEIDPSLVHTPTLLIYGDRDPFASLDAALFETLGTTDRQQVVLSGLDHAAHLEHPTEFVDALQRFLERSR